MEQDIAILCGHLLPALIHTCPEGHLTSYSVTTGALALAQSSWGIALTTVPHLAQRLKKGYSYTTTSCLCLRGILQGELYLYQRYTTVQLWMKTNQTNIHNTHFCTYYLLLSFTSNSAVLMQGLCYQMYVHTRTHTVHTRN